MPFKGTYLSLMGIQWDLSPDGKHFLMIKTQSGGSGSEAAPRERITVVLNWFEELKQLVPGK